MGEGAVFRRRRLAAQRDSNDWSYVSGQVGAVRPMSFRATVFKLCRELRSQGGVAPLACYGRVPSARERPSPNEDFNGAGIYGVSLGVFLEQIHWGGDDNAFRRHPS